MKKVNVISHKVVCGLLDYLSLKGEDGILPAISGELRSLVKKSSKEDLIVARSVIPLSKTQKDTISKELSRVFGRILPVENILDKKLIGGFSLTVGEWYLDGTLATQVKKIKGMLLAS